MKRVRIALAVIGVLLLTFALAIAAARHGPRLGLDGYYYVEFAKTFTEHPPTSFGDLWPFGWPLLGTALSLSGISCYHGLVAAGYLSLAGMLIIAACWMPWREPGTLGSITMLAAASSLPIWNALTTTALSEVAFAFALLALARSLARWPDRGAIAVSMLAALAALSLRYVGAVAFAIVATWGVSQLAALRQERRLQYAIVAWCVAAGLAGALLVWNRVATGYFSGGDRGRLADAAEVLPIVADFGWSCASAIAGLAAQRLLGYNTAAGVPLGLVFTASLLALAGWAWYRPAGPRIRPLALVAILYPVAFIGLRLIGQFDSLSPRIGAPLVFPTLLLLAWQAGPRVRGIVAGTAALLVAANVAYAIRGTSGEIGGPDLRFAAAAISTRVTSGEVIGVNDQALTLSALVRPHVRRVWPRDEAGIARCSWLVIAGRPIDRAGHTAGISPPWRGSVNRLIQTGQFTRCAEHQDWIVLERRPSANGSLHSAPGATGAPPR